MTSKVSFKAKVSTELGQRVVVVGSDPIAGSWSHDRSNVKLVTDATNYPSWVGSCMLPADTDFLFKVVVVCPGGRSLWEDKVPDRQLHVPAAEVTLDIIFDCPEMGVTTASAESNVLVATPEKLDQQLHSAVEETEKAVNPACVGIESGPHSNIDSPHLQRLTPEPTESDPHEAQISVDLEQRYHHALEQVAEGSRLLEIAESRAEQAELRAKEAEKQVWSLEQKVAELTALLAVNQRHEPLVQKAKSTGNVDAPPNIVMPMTSEALAMKEKMHKLHETRSRRYSGSSPGSVISDEWGEMRMPRSFLTQSSAASAMSETSDRVGAAPMSRIDSVPELA